MAPGQAAPADEQLSLAGSDGDQAQQLCDSRSPTEVDVTRGEEPEVGLQVLQALDVGALVTLANAAFATQLGSNRL